MPSSVDPNSYHQLSNREFAELAYEVDGVTCPDDIHNAIKEEAKRRRALDGFILIRELNVIHRERSETKAQELIEKSIGAKAVRLREVESPERYVIISRDNESEVGWRGTRFDERGPVGHVNFPSLEVALRSYSGQWLDEFPGPPYGRVGEFVFDGAMLPNHGNKVNIAAMEEKIAALQAHERTAVIPTNLQVTT